MSKTASFIRSWAAGSESENARRLAKSLDSIDARLADKTRTGDARKSMNVQFRRVYAQLRAEGRRYFRFAVNLDAIDSRVFDRIEVPVGYRVMKRSYYPMPMLHCVKC